MYVEQSVHDCIKTLLNNVADTRAGKTQALPPVFATPNAAHLAGGPAAGPQRYRGCKESARGRPSGAGAVDPVDVERCQVRSGTNTRPHGSVRFKRKALHEAVL